MFKKKENGKKRGKTAKTLKFGDVTRDRRKNFAYFRLHV